MIVQFRGDLRYSLNPLLEGSGLARRDGQRRDRIHLVHRETVVVDCGSFFKGPIQEANREHGRDTQVVELDTGGGRGKKEKN